MGIWKFFDGKKRIIGAVFTVIALFLTEFIVGIWEYDPEWMDKLIRSCLWIAGVFGGTGAIHAGVKSRRKPSE